MCGVKNVQMLVHTQEQGQTFFMTRAKEDNIDQFQYVKIHPKIIDLSKFSAPNIAFLAF